MRPIRASAAILTILACTAHAASASAAVDVGISDGGTVRIVGGDTADRITITRLDESTIAITDSAGAASSADATCTVDPATGAATCAATDETVVVASLGAGADTIAFDGATATLRIDDATTTDVVDLSATADPITVRWQRARQRLVATCGSCTLPWSVLLPTTPGRVELGSGDDDVDLRTWPGRGRTTWQLWDGRDRFRGAAGRRSVVQAGAGADSLVGYAAADVFDGDSDSDKLADFGGRGDVLRGGAGIDAISSMDRQRDVLDGGADRDFCLTPHGHDARSCDTGPVRRFEDSRYLPLTTQAWVLRMLGIR